MRRLILMIVLAGCSNGDDCQDLGGLYFDSADADTVMPTAVGGAQRFTGSTDACNGRVPVTDLLGVTQDPSIATVQIVSGELEVTGVAAGTAGVHATSTQAGSDASFRVVAITHVALAGQGFHATVATGVPALEIQLLGSDDTACVDRNVTVTGTLGLGDRWDHLLIENAAPGDYDETIHAGGKDWPVTVTVTR